MPTHPTLEPAPESIETERLLLRPYQAGDGAVLIEAIEESRAEMDAWLNWPKNIQTIDDAEDLCIRRRADWLRRIEFTYGIFLRESNQYIGAIGLHNIDWSNRTLEVGYFVRRSATGNGYASEALIAVTNVAINELSFNRVELSCDSQNLASARVAERASFVFEGRLRNLERGEDGTLRDFLIYSRIPNDEGDAGASPS
ncbi:GNAT family N-acetyltransferase [soil metagenome]